MKPATTPLTESEIDRLDRLLMDEDVTEEGMTLEILDGYLHAIVVGPRTISPSVWLPKIFEAEDGRRTMTSDKAMEETIGLIFRHYNKIAEGFVGDVLQCAPIWFRREFEGAQYDDAESWAYGFTEAMKLNWSDWLPMMESEEGARIFRPIGLLGLEDFGPEQEAMSRSVPKRAAVALEIPNTILDIYNYWLPLREAIHERTVAQIYRKQKVGRNEPCPCGSGKKFKKCCGMAADLH